MTLRREWPRVTEELIRRVREEPSLPTPAQQGDHLILFLGDTLRFPGRGEARDLPQWAAIVGAFDSDGAQFVITALVDDGLAATGLEQGNPTLELTYTGWERYEDLKRARVVFRRAFMAMQFGIEELDRIVSECFKPAVEQTGFDLIRADDEPLAGLIDDRIRVAIMTSRFLIADLTGDNSGAYWEAGYAEGLRKPVVYTCEQSHFDEHATHFDTRNRHTVIWAAGEPERAAAQLKATIRTTLPEEAILEDEPAE